MKLPAALILPLLGSDAGPWLAAVRQLTDEHSRSDPHVTVRYPIKRIDVQRIRSSKAAKIETIEIVGAGAFANRRGDRSVVYLECASDLLESYSYKPDFPDSIFHVTLYEGPTTAFSNSFIDILYSFPWQRVISLDRPTPFEEIPIGKGAGKRRRSGRYSAETRKLVARIAPGCGDLDELNEQARLQLVRKVIEHLHSELETHDLAGSAVELTYLPTRLLKSEQQTFWTSSPIPYEGSSVDGHRMNGDLARGGSLVLTPPELAEQIVEFGLGATESRQIRYGDPAFGSGIFFAVLSRLIENTDHRLVDASAVEVNQDRAWVAANRWARRSLHMLVGDFLTADPKARWNFVVANPPYVRSQAIPEDLKKHLGSHLLAKRGLAVPSRSNLYVYFVLACHEWMCEAGVAAWLLPADFMETRYGEVLRTYLTTQVELLLLHTFDPERSQFENVRVSSAVVVYRVRRPEGHGEVVVSRGGSISEPDQQFLVRVEDLRTSANWRTAAKRPARAVTAESQVTIGDIFTIRRGIATGANDFFVLEKEAADELGIELDEIVPLLPRPRFMPRDGVVRAHDDGTPIVDPLLYLVTSDKSLSTLRTHAPNLASYLESVPDKVLQGHLVSKRSLFYQQENRLPAKIVASSMGRFVEDAGPIRFYLNESDAVVLNNYLCLYPKNSQEWSSSDTARKLVEALWQIDPNEFRRNGREYADGLFKLEPRGLAKVRVPLTPADLARLWPTP